IGAGEMGTLVARHFRGAGVKKILVINRTWEKAEWLARELGDATAIPFEKMPEALAQAELIISSTSAREYVLTQDMVKTALQTRKTQWRFFFDLAVPRDIEPSIAEIHGNIFLYHIDDIKSIVQANLAQRQKEAEKVERLIDEDVAAFTEKMGAQTAGPIIRQLRDKAEKIREEQLEKLWRHCPQMSAEEKTAVSDATRLMMNKFLNDPMGALRRLGHGEEEQNAVYLDAVCQLFQLDEEEKAPIESTYRVLHPAMRD
ncbi:MAG: glutamyl-tRNA reductase, partial [Firmicutes bacterium]|nr:glutamyl-tRNA reductase [Bacillota bacterium]